MKMKEFFKGMDLNGTIAYMVQKQSAYLGKWDRLECCIEPEWVGGDKAYKKLVRTAYTQYELSSKLLNWLMKKPHQLVCQYCGSVKDTHVNSDLHCTVTMCKKCTEAIKRSDKQS